MKKRVLAGLAAFTLALLLISGFNIYAVQKTAKPKIKTNYKKSYTLLINQINRLIKNKQGRYGVYFVSLTYKKEFGINANEEYEAASTIKLPMNLYVYNQIVNKKVNPNKMLTYTKADYETGTGNLQYQKIGTRYSIRELSKLSITTSDNVAINMLIHYFGLENMLKFNESLVRHKTPRYRNISSPRDMALYLKELIDFKANHPKEGNELIGYLKNTIYNDRLPKYLPHSVSVAHKIGTQTAVANDVGIIYDKHPFILTVMSKNIDESEASEVIAKISKIVYDYEQK